MKGRKQLELQNKGCEHVSDLSGNSGIHEESVSSEGLPSLVSQATPESMALTGTVSTPGETGVSGATEPIAPSVLRACIGPVGLAALAQDLAGSAHATVEVACDSNAHPRLAAFDVNGTTYLLDLTLLRELSQVREALANVALSGFGTPDVAVLGISRENVWDAQVAAGSVFAGELPSLPTREAVRAHTDLPPKRESIIVVSDFPTFAELEALVSRTRETSRVVDAVRARAVRDNCQDALELDLAVRPVLRDMTLKGIRLHAPGWRELVEETEGRVEALRARVKEILGIENLHDHDDVYRRLYDGKVYVDSTASEDLAEYTEVPGVAELIELRQKEAFLVDAGKNVLEAFERSLDERVHPIWNPLGTVTGRITCTGPGLLSVPRWARKYFIPGPGNVFVTADYSAAQLRILAETERDKALMAVFDQGGDPHLATAAHLMGLSESSAGEHREKAKPINFGLPFGMTKKGLVSYAKSEFDVDLSAAEVEQYFARYFEKHEQVREWHDRVRADLPLETRSLGGRIRRFRPGDHDFAARLASPIQGTEADAMKRALTLLAPALTAFGAALVLVHYDSVLVECPAEQGPAVRELVERLMTDAMQHYLAFVPIVVKADVRSSWGG